MPRTRHWYYRLVVCLFSFSGGFPPGPPWKSINHSVIKGSCIITLPRIFYYFLQQRGTQCEKDNVYIIILHDHNNIIHSFFDVAHHDVVEIKKSLQYCMYILWWYHRYAVIIFLWVVFSELFFCSRTFFRSRENFFFLSRVQNANHLLGYRGTRRSLRTKKANANKKNLSITPVRSLQRNW